MKNQLIRPALLMFLLFMAANQQVSAQGGIDLYNYDLKLINPAFLAVDSDFEITGFYKARPFYYNDNTETYMFTHANRIGASNSAIGSMVWYQDNDLARWIRFSTGYSYKFNLTDKSKLSFGAYLKYSNLKVDPNYYVEILPDHPEVINELNSIERGVDMDLGVGYISGNSRIGLNVSNIWAPSNSVKTFNPRRRRYNAFISQKLNINHWLSFTPSLMFKTDFSQRQLDINGVFVFKNLILFGINYEWRENGPNDINLSAGVRVKDKAEFIVRGFSLLRSTSVYTPAGLDIEAMLKLKLGRK